MARRLSRSAKRSRVVSPRIKNPAARKAAVRKATSRVRAKKRINFARSVRRK